MALEGLTATTLNILQLAETATAKQATPEATLEALASWIHDHGTGAGRQNDSLFIRRDDGNWDEYHAVAYTDGGYTLKPFRGVWHYAG